MVKIVTTKYVQIVGNKLEKKVELINMLTDIHSEYEPVPLDK